MDRRELFGVSPAKKQRHIAGRTSEAPSAPEKREGGAGSSAAAEQVSPAVAQPHAAPSAAQSRGGSNEDEKSPAGGAVNGPTEPAVTDAAHAFRELRVRPALSGSDRQAGGPAGTAVAEGRPPSPKKRKAASNLDKDFILKDDKVKRATDAQGDISEARGMLGALLHEFRAIELNRDLLEAIKRTESKTGRLGRAATSSVLDRPSFEVLVAETCELLQSQLSTVEAHTDSSARRSAILRAYAVQAIAAFADEDDSSDDDDDGEEEELAAAIERQAALAEAPEPAGPEGGEDGIPGAPRPGSAAAFYSPQRGQHRTLGPQQQQPLVQVHRPAGSAAGEQVSSSVLPDAPADSALEDTAAMSSQQPSSAAQELQGQQQQQQQQQQQGQAGPGVGSGVGGCVGQLEQQPQQQRVAAPGPATSAGPAGSEVQPCSSGHDAQMLAAQPSDATLEDMVRSPVPMDSRPDPPSVEKLRAQLAQQAQLAGSPAAEQGMPQQSQQQQQRRQDEVDELAAMGSWPRPPRPYVKREASFTAGADSSGRAGSDAAAGEQPKRQRKAGGGGVIGALAAALARQRQGLAGVAEESAAALPGSDTDAGELEEEGEEEVSGFRRTLQLLSHEQDGTVGGAEERAQHSQPMAQPAPAHAGSPGTAPGSGCHKERSGSGGGGGQQGEQAAAGQPPQQEQQEPNASDATRRAAGRSGALLQAAPSASASVWGSTLVCADLTVNDVASQYWPFLRSAMQGSQGTQLHADDEALIAGLVAALGETIASSYAARGSPRGSAAAAALHSGGGGAVPRPSPDLKSLVAATAFDDMFRDRLAAESSGASGN